MLRILVIIGLVSLLFGCGTVPTHPKTGKKDQPCYFYQAGSGAAVEKTPAVKTKMPAKMK